MAHCEIASGWSCHVLPGQQGQGLASACTSGRGSQCWPLEPKMVVVTRACARSPVGSVLLHWNVHRDRSSYGGPTPLLMCLPIMVPCLSGGPRLLPSTPSVAMTRLLQAISAPNPGPLPGTQLQSLSFSTLPQPSPTVECQVGECSIVVLTLYVGYTLFCLPQTSCCSLLLHSKSPPPSSLISPVVRNLPKVWELFLLHSSFPGVQTPSCFLLFLFPFVVPVYMEVFLSL